MALCTWRGGVSELIGGWQAVVRVARGRERCPFRQWVAAVCGGVAVSAGVPGARLLLFGGVGFLRPWGGRAAEAHTAHFCLSFNFIFLSTLFSTLCRAWECLDQTARRTSSQVFRTFRSGCWLTCVSPLPRAGTRQ